MTVLDQFQLVGKVAIVTGAGSNLGREMALALATAGSNIVGVGRRPEPLEETAGMVREKGQEFLSLPTDVTDSNAVEAMIQSAISHFGQIDILVNNPAVASRYSF